MAYFETPSVGPIGLSTRGPRALKSDAQLSEAAFLWPLADLSPVFSFTNAVKRREQEVMGRSKVLSRSHLRTHLANTLYWQYRYCSQLSQHL